MAIYDPDPQHLWNRLYAILFVRSAPDGQAYGQDEIDPLLWSDSTYLLTEPGHGRAIALLDEFLQHRGDELILEPLKRALLQRDLLSIFEWTADPLVEDQDELGRLHAPRRALRRRLVDAIRRLGLDASEIQALPDNYSAALAAQTIPAAEDPAHPERAFLPPDLFDGNGPWVMLEVRGGGMAAPAHMDLLRGRSLFFVLLRLPGGRSAALDYLARLRTFPNPVMPRPADTSAPQEGPLLNPDLPQFPPGTQFALVRQMIHIDRQGRPQLTRLIESVEIRTFSALPDETAAAEHSRQGFHKIALRRQDLFAGRSGGLGVVSSEDAEFDLLSGPDEDVFEKASGGWVRRRTTARTENLRSCMSCHAQEPGIHSILTYQRVPPPDLVESDRDRQARAALSWKKLQYSWGLLAGLIEQR